MAVVDSILGATSRVEARLLELKTVLQMVADACPADEPAWLFTLRRYVDSVDSAFVEFVDVVHEQAMPHVRDIESARRQMGMKPAIQA